MNQFTTAVGGFIETSSIPYILVLGVILFIIGTGVLYVLASLLRNKLSLKECAKVVAIVDIANIVATLVLFNVIEYRYFYSYGLYDRVSQWVLPAVLMAVVIIVGVLVLRRREGMSLVKAVAIAVISAPVTYIIAFVVLFSPIIQSWLNIG